MKRYFKNLWTKILRFWFFRVRNRRMHHLEQGGFIIDFYMYDMRIRSVSGNFSMKIGASEHPFGYLVQSLAQHKESSIHGYAAYMYMFATELTKDDKLRKDLSDALSAYEKRVSALKATPESERRDAVDLQVVRADVARGAMTRQERRRLERESMKANKHHNR